MDQVSIYQKLVNIQKELKAPKNQRNTFGNYNYRSCEDILEGVKPLLDKYGLSILLSDEIVHFISAHEIKTIELLDSKGRKYLEVVGGDRYYVKATATLTDGEKVIQVSAFAREEENKKGMDGSQITGASSSYARKYALNGLFAIDDTKDSDKTSETKKIMENVKVEQAVIDQIDAVKNVVDLTNLCTKLTTGKSPAYKKAVFEYYKIKKDKLGGNI